MQIETWVAAEVYTRIAAAVKQHGGARLKPIFIALDEQISYDDIRIVVAHLTKSPNDTNSACFRSRRAVA